MFDGAVIASKDISVLNSISFAKPLFLLLSLIAFIALVTGCVVDDETIDDGIDENTAFADATAVDADAAVDPTPEVEALRAVLSDGGVRAAACEQSDCVHRPSCRFPKTPRPGWFRRCGNGRISILCC
jgi:hypothetical protein